MLLNKLLLRAALADAALASIAPFSPQRKNYAPWSNRTRNLIRPTHRLQNPLEIADGYWVRFDPGTAL